MKRVVAVAVLGLLIAMTLPRDAFTGAAPKQLIAPMAYYMGPIDWMIGWAAGKIADYLWEHRNDPGAATSLGSAWWADGYATPTGGGGGGGW